MIHFRRTDGQKFGAAISIRADLIVAIEQRPDPWLHSIVHLQGGDSLEVAEAPDEVERRWKKALK